jgi:glucose-1-phosphate adenylyltransferase
MDRRLFAPHVGARARSIGDLTRDTLAVILAAGRGERLGMLTDWRAKPAMPYGGKFRIIDFTLSNCRNSQLRKILILTQYKSHSLIRHVRNGWIAAPGDCNEFTSIVPAQQWIDEQTWYRSSADAVYQSLDIIRSCTPRFVIVLAGDQIYNLDYREVLLQHVRTGAELTIACTAVPVEAAPRYGVVEVDAIGRITAFSEMPPVAAGLPDDPTRALVSMGIYVFSLERLARQLDVDHGGASSRHNFGADIIPAMLAEGARLHAYRLRSPVVGAPAWWQDVRSIDDYFDANMALLASPPPIDLHHPAWPVTTHQPQLPPARISGAGIEACIVADGCRVRRSQLRRSLLSSGVVVEEDCRLDDVLALPGCRIGAGSRLANVIVENGCQVPPGTIIGEDAPSDCQRYHVTGAGRLVVSREMLAPSGAPGPGRILDVD